MSCFRTIRGDPAHFRRIRWRNWPHGEVCMRICVSEHKSTKPLALKPATRLRLLPRDIEDRCKYIEECKLDAKVIDTKNIFWCMETYTISQIWKQETFEKTHQLRVVRESNGATVADDHQPCLPRFPNLSWPWYTHCQNPQETHAGSESRTTIPAD